MGFLNFFKMSAPKPLLTEDQMQQKVYRSFAIQSFIAGTIGYSLYYVCRTSLNVMKDPIIDSGTLSKEQLGVIGGCLLFAYAFGKLVNGFIADHSNIKRFMSVGLLVSAFANLAMGVIGLLGSDNDMLGKASIPSMVVFMVFAIMWGVNGWVQSMGAPPAIIALSRWFPLSKRGTYYGFFSASHNIGEWLSFIFVGLIVATAGWQWGFFGAAIAGIIGVVIILFMMHDTPESKGLPSIEQLTGDKAESKKKDESLKEIQKQVLKNPAVWILALASAFMYISRYSLNSWGVLFLQKEKGFDLAEATFIISINALLGILGTVLAGWMSDSLFKGDRKMPAFVSGVLLSISYALFIYGGNEYWVNILSMVLFGIAIGVLIAFLGGLMAVDIVPRKATGAALGVVGMASYIAAGLQDVISPWLIREKKTTVDIAPETQELYQNIINTAQTDIPNATETVSKISENLDVLKEGVLHSEMTGQVSQEFAKKFLDMQDKFGELGDEFVKGTDHISDKVVNLAEKALEKGSVVVETYDFSDAAIFWIGASVISFLLPMLLWGKKKVEE